jgi:ATP-binding cassette, subfamily B, bacterial
VAVLGETVTDILEPWPIKIVVDNILQSKKLPPVLGGIVTGLFGQNTDAIVDFAVAAVALIAIVGAVSSYFKKYLTTSVSQWVGHDLTEAPESLFPALSKKPTHDSNCTRDRIRGLPEAAGDV